MTSPNVSPLTVAIAALIRARMASQTPEVSRTELSRASGLSQATLSRLLKPTQVMNVLQLDAICRALGMDVGELIDAGRSVVAEHEADRLRGQIREVPTGRARPGRAG